MPTTATEPTLMNRTYVVISSGHDLLLLNGPLLPAFFLPREEFEALRDCANRSLQGYAITSLASLLILESLRPRITDVHQIAELPPVSAGLAAFRFETDFGCSFACTNTDDASGLMEWAASVEIHCLLTLSGAVFTAHAHQQRWFNAGLVESWSRLNESCRGKHVRDLESGWKHASAAILDLLGKKP